MGGMYQRILQERFKITPRLVYDIERLDVQEREELARQKEEEERKNKRMNIVKELRIEADVERK